MPLPASLSSQHYEEEASRGKMVRLLVPGRNSRAALFLRV